jgi:hypothetical protein
VSKKRQDWGEMQEQMTRAIIAEMRSDLDDLLAGLEAGSLSYIDALNCSKVSMIRLLERSRLRTGRYKFP